MCKAKSLPSRQGWSTMEGSRCRAAPGDRWGTVCCCQMLQRAMLSCLCIVAAHHGLAREQKNGEKAELGSIMKTMHLTSLAGDAV